MLQAILDVLLPRSCAICGRTLSRSEKAICATCYVELPILTFPSFERNYISDLLENDVVVERAAAFMSYYSELRNTELMLANKYRGRTDVGEQLGAWSGKKFMDEGFFEGIDMMIPVPISWQRKWQRGYNQTSCICKGMHKMTGMAVSEGNLVRTVNTESQVGKSTMERKKNVANVFDVRHPEALAGKHVLVVDDVLTTGATIASCVKTLQEKVEDIRVSIFAIGIVGETWNMRSSLKDDLELEF